MFWNCWIWDLFELFGLESSTSCRLGGEKFPMNPSRSRSRLTNGWSWKTSASRIFQSLATRASTKARGNNCNLPLNFSLTPFWLISPSFHLFFAGRTSVNLNFSTHHDFAALGRNCLSTTPSMWSCPVKMGTTFSHLLGRATSSSKDVSCD